MSRSTTLTILTFFTIAVCNSDLRADQLFNDDAIVKGSLAVGVDAVNGENFGFDTIRLKENNLRIAFIDTSSISSFPGVDWEIMINDSANGGANHFSIINRSRDSKPFRIFDGAKDSALVLGANSYIGVGTSNPVQTLHMTDGNSPSIRLDQTSAAGFTAQVWDVAGNEANFFIRDATHQTLPFKIEPLAPDNSFVVDSGGQVGLGVRSPMAKLHVTGSGLFESNLTSQATISGVTGSFSGNLTSQATVSGVSGSFSGAASGATASPDADELVVENNADAGISILTPSGKNGHLYFGDPSSNTQGGMSYKRTRVGDQLFLRVAGSNSIIVGQNGTITTLTGATLSAGGSWTDASSLELKQDIADLSGDEALRALTKMRPVTFAYKTDPSEQKVGFIAEEVPDLVANNDRKGLSPMDIIGVLTRVVQIQEERINVQRAELDVLQAKIKDLHR